MTPRLALSIQEFADAIGVSRWNVGELIRRGKLRTLPDVRPTRIPVSELDRMLGAALATMGEPGLAAPEPISCDEPPQLDPVVVRRMREV